uniref:Mitochondrial carrier protein n=1 Tax=Parastrongyloides trichosuri TaxID=131310 RepID=A0A0N4ZK47_PARTI
MQCYLVIFLILFIQLEKSHSLEDETPSTNVSLENKKIYGRWYFGGIASCGAALISHPLDSIKVHLQTQNRDEPGSRNIIQTIIYIFHVSGILGFYSGISGSLLRQITYSTARFAFYEYFKSLFLSFNGQLVDDNVDFKYKIILAAVAGAISGLIGTPGDLVNVRMQNDSKLCFVKRRNYKNCFHAIYIIIKEEGFYSLFNGSSMAIVRAISITIGQIAFYDQFVQVIRTLDFFNEPLNHIIASIAASSTGTICSQPIDVIKTRMMNARKDEYTGTMECIYETWKSGPLNFYNGFLLAWIRLAPHTICMFVIYEQLKKNFGYYKN